MQLQYIHEQKPFYLNCVHLMISIILQVWFATGTHIYMAVYNFEDMDYTLF